MADKMQTAARQALQRVTVTVELDDGRVLDVVLRPLSLVAAERHFAGTIPAMEGTLFAAWHQLTGAQGPLHADALTFADFLEKLVAIDEAAAVPTSASPAEPSPSSP